MDEPLIVTKLATLGPWMRSVRSGSEASDPPHGPEDGGWVQVDALRASDDPASVYAVQDADGCQALVIGFEEEATDGQG